MLKIKKTSSARRKNNIKIKINKRVFLSFLISLSLVIFLISFMFELPSSAVVAAVSLVILMSHSLYEGIGRAKQKNIFNISLAVCAASLILFCFGGFQQAVCCMLIYSAGKLVLEGSAGLRSVSSEICGIINEKKYHRVEDRETYVVSSEDIKSGDFIELFSGEYVPVDGYVKAGSGTVSTINVTGDSKIETKYSGDYLMAGYTLLSGNVILEAKTDTKESTLAQNCIEIENALSHKTTLEKTLNIITNGLSLAAFAVIIILSVIKFVKTGDAKSVMYFIPAGILFSQWELIRMVISDAYRVGIYRLSKKGIILRKKSFAENNLFTRNIGFTVNGVLTAKSSKICDVYTELDITKEELLKFAAYAQYKNETDISKAIVKSANCRVKQSEISEYKRYDGDGSSIKLFGNIDVVTGTSDLLKSFDIVSGVENDSSKLCVAINGNYVGYIEFENEIRQDLRQCMDSLRFAGIKKITVVSEGSVRTVSEIIKRASLGRAENSLKYDEFMCRYNDDREKVLLFCSDEYVWDSEYVSCVSYDGRENENAQAYTFVNNLAAPVNMLSVIKDVKMLMLQNTFICLVYKLVFLFMLAGGKPILWLCFVLIFVTSLLIKMNELRMLKKL